MTDTLKNAAHATAYILGRADHVRHLLAGDGPRSNAAGILSNPGDYLFALRCAFRGR